MLSEIIDVIISGLTNGSVYALMAVGLTLVYGVSKAFNFAYGSFYSLGGYVAWSIVSLGIIGGYFTVLNHMLYDGGPWHESPIYPIAHLDLILSALDGGGKVVVTGLGKNLHIAEKVSGTLASTGATSVVLNPAQAMHGDLGIFCKGDAKCGSRMGTKCTDCV